MKELTRDQTINLFGGQASEARCQRIRRRRDRNLHRNWSRYTRLRDRYDRLC